MVLERQPAQKRIYGGAGARAMGRKRAADKARRFLNAVFGSIDTMQVYHKGARLPLSVALTDFNNKQRVDFFNALHDRFTLAFGSRRLKINPKNADHVFDTVQDIISQELERIELS